MRISAAPLLLLWMACASAVADPGTPDAPSDAAWTSRWGIGLTASNFDVDSRDSEEPHLNAFNAGVVLSYRAARYLAVDLEYFEIEDVAEETEFGDVGRITGHGVMLSGRLRWPLIDDLGMYLRLGATQLNFDGGSRFADRDFGSPTLQPAVGFGVHGRFWFLEYLNHGQQDGVHLEQLRSGIGFRF